MSRESRAQRRCFRRRAVLEPNVLGARFLTRNRPRRPPSSFAVRRSLVTRPSVQADPRSPPLVRAHSSTQPGPAMSRPRSSTTSSSTSTSLRTESSRSYYASNPSALLTPASESVAIAIPSSSTGSGGPSTSSFAASQSWQSAHSLDTIRPGRARTSSQGSSDSEGSGSTNTAGPPPVVISLSSPGSPAPAQPTYHTASASSLPLPQTRQRSVSNASSVSLHLQPDLPTFIPARIRDWLLDHPIVTAGIKAALLFAVAVGSLYLLLHTLLPELDEADKGAVKMPKSFEELKALNEVLQVGLIFRYLSGRAERQRTAQLTPGDGAGVQGAQLLARARVLHHRLPLVRPLPVSDYCALNAAP